MPPETLSTAAFLSAVRQHRRDPLLVLLAFDGVLVEYRADPARARLSARRTVLLRRLLRANGVEVGIISGRRIADVRRRARLGRIAYYIGLHGLEATGPGVPRRNARTLAEYSARFREVAARLHQSIAGVRGVRIELKDAVLALHTHAASPADAVWSRFCLLNATANLVNANAVRILRGRHVLELMPNVGPAKADAIVDIQRTIEHRYRRSVFTVYIGEGVPDDDAFDALRRDAVAAVVGCHRHQTVCHLPSPATLDELLEAIIASRRTNDESDPSVYGPVPPFIDHDGSQSIDQPPRGSDG